MKTRILLIFISFICINTNLLSQGTIDPENKKLNDKCFECHNKNFVTLKDPASGTEKKFPQYQMIDEAEFYDSNHKTFKCFDCHSEEYDSFPHNYSLKFEYLNSCLDCHGGDPQYAKFHFEQINDEFTKSVHSTKHSEQFTCWMCHDPHFYKTNATKNNDIGKTVAYDNSICLSCHANIRKYNLILDKQNPNILQKHEWLPNQKNHFESVRCIECHARVNDSILVAHNVQPKDKAVKRCVECHSSNSLLMQTLYKYQSKEKLAQQGFLNSVIMSESYVVGANRNIIFTIIYICMLGATLLIIVGHTILRIRNHNKNRKS